MRFNIFRLKIWMLIHMIMMNIFLIYIMDFSNWSILINIFTLYFIICIIEELNSSNVQIASQEEGK